MQLTEAKRAELERLMEQLQRTTDQYLRCPDVYMWEWAKSLLAVLKALTSSIQAKDSQVTTQAIPTETLESGVVVVPVEEYRYLVGSLEEYDEAESRMGNYSEERARMIRTANARLRQNGEQIIPTSRLSATLTDEERRIVCEALGYYTDHYSEYEDHPDKATAGKAHDLKLRGWALRDRLQQNGGETC